MSGHSRSVEGGGSLSPETVLYQTRYGVYGLMYDNAIKYKNKEYLQDNTLEGRTRYLQEAEMRNTDWFKELFQHSIRHQHTVSLASGGQVSNFYASLGATIDPGWAKVQSENTYFFNLNATFKPHKYWTFGRSSMHPIPETMTAGTSHPSR